MRCEKCGAEINSLEVDMFNYDGTDNWYDVEISEDYDVISMSVFPNWTGDELDEDEQADTIRCPHCKQFPFIDRCLETCRYVSVIMYPKKRKEE